MACLQFADLQMNGWPPAMKGSCKYSEKAALDSQHRVVPQIVMKCSKSPRPGWALWLNELNDRIRTIDLAHGI
jgi:hypothetical protein